MCVCVFIIIPPYWIKPTLLTYIHISIYNNIYYTAQLFAVAISPPPPFFLRLCIHSPCYHTLFDRGEQGEERLIRGEWRKSLIIMRKGKWRKLRENMKGQWNYKRFWFFRYFCLCK